MSRASDRAFTIVEMMIVIVVISILAVLTIVSYSALQQSARDSQRDGDVARIKIALEKYFAENSQYPDACGGDDVICVASSLDTPLASFITSMPEDPQFPTTYYEYVRGGTNGNAYALRISYEAKDDCQTGVRVEAGWWVGLPSC